MSPRRTAIQHIALDRPEVSKVGPGAVEAVTIWGKGASTIIYMAQVSHWLKIANPLLIIVQIS